MISALTEPTPPFPSVAQASSVQLAEGQGGAILDVSIPDKF